MSFFITLQTMTKKWQDFSYERLTLNLLESRIYLINVLSVLELSLASKM